jgi:DNA modification methylase
MILHESDLATIYCGDSLEVVPTLEPVDLIATDPPYGVKWRSNHGQNFAAIEGDESTEVGYEVLRRALEGKVLRPFRHVYAFGPFALPDLPLVKAGTPLVWDKEHTGMGDLSLPWGPAHEPIQFGVHVPSKANRTRGDGRLAARLRQGSVLRCHRKNATAVTRHPTEKPVALMAQLIEASSVQGDLVLDPFGGVGSTAVAAILAGRRAVLIEKDPGYAAIAVERVKRAEQLAQQARGI